MSNKSVRVRFAPSPTGPLHIGGVKTALYNYLFARQNKGAFILRVEDTDQVRYVEGAEQYIIDSLKWCGLQYDEGPDIGGNFGPYRQSERKEIYKQYAEHLVDTGNAYLAFDTPEELEAMRERLKTKENPTPQYDAATRREMSNSLTLPDDEVKRKVESGEAYVIRVKMPENEEVIFHDLIREEVRFSTSLLDDKVLYKSDGFPTYHLANVVDDYLMQISHVIRGEEWLPSTPLHILLYKFLGWESEMPQFAHIPLILKPDGKGKLSKRDGDRLGFPVFPLNWKDPESGETSMGYREMGFLPEAFINMLAFLGWNPGTEQEIFTPDDLIGTFSIDRIGKGGAKFDFEKAKWFNQQFIRNLDSSGLCKRVKVLLEEQGINKDDAFIKAFTGLLLERVTFIQDFWEQGKYFFQFPVAYEEQMVKKRWKENSPEIFKELITLFENTDPFKSATIETAVKTFIEDRRLGFGDILPGLRLALSGIMQGPAVFDIAELLGKEETVKRIRIAIKKFNEVVSLKSDY